MANNKKSLPTRPEYEAAIEEIAQAHLKSGHVVTRPFIKGFDDPEYAKNGRMSGNVCTTGTCGLINKAFKKIGLPPIPTYRTNQELYDAAISGEIPFKVQYDTSKAHRKGDIVIFGDEEMIRNTGATHSSVAMGRKIDPESGKETFPYYSAGGGAVRMGNAFPPVDNDRYKFYLTLDLPESSPVSKLQKRPFKTNSERPRTLRKIPSY